MLLANAAKDMTLVSVSTEFMKLRLRMRVLRCAYRTALRSCLLLVALSLGAESGEAQDNPFYPAVAHDELFGANRAHVDQSPGTRDLGKRLGENLTKRFGGSGRRPLGEIVAMDPKIASASNRQDNAEDQAYSGSHDDLQGPQ